MRNFDFEANSLRRKRGRCEKDSWAEDEEVGKRGFIFVRNDDIGRLSKTVLQVRATRRCFPTGSELTNFDELG